MKSKKILSTLLALSCVFSFAACEVENAHGGVIFPQTSGPQEGPAVVENVKDCLNAPTGLPVYTDDGERFEMLAFGLPRYRNESIFKDMADAGITLAILDNWSGHGKFDSPELEASLLAAEQAGVDVLISTDNGYGNRGNGAQYGEGNEWRTIAGITTDYTQFKAFRGIMIFDEPGGTYGNTGEYNDFDHLEREWALWKNYWVDPDGEGPKEAVFKNGTHEDYLFYVNGCGDIEHVFNPLAERIYPIIEGDCVVSIDHYPFKYDNAAKRAYMSENGLYHVEAFANYARDNDDLFWNFLETTDIYNTGRTADTNSMLSEVEIRMQHGMSMAFGATGFEYFTYATASDMKGYVDNGGTKYESYYYCQKINQEVQKFAHVFMDFKWQGLIPVLGTKNAVGYNDAFDLLTTPLEITDNDRLRSVSATRDTLVGCFKDGNGFDGYMLVNYNDPYYRKSDDVSIRFNNATKAVVWNRGESKVVDLTNGTFNYKLLSGDWAFVIPVV